jgi:hypothetical protein
MGVPTPEIGYTSTTTGRGYHEVHKGHVVAKIINIVLRRVTELLVFNRFFYMLLLRDL